jgi:uncharacterized protein YndB with AHSA1/START domain
MKRSDLTLCRFIPGPADEVFAVWFDPASPGGPWYGAKKALMNVAVDGMFYFGIERAAHRAHLAAEHGLELLGRADDVGLDGHFGRFTAVERPRVAEHTWMSEYTHGIETHVTVTFAARDGGTQLTIVHRGLPDDEAGRAHERGWTFLLARTEQHFASKSSNE